MRPEFRRRSITTLVAVAALAGGGLAGVSWADDGARSGSDGAAPAIQKSTPLPVASTFDASDSARRGRPTWIYRTRTFSLAANSSGGGVVKCKKRGYIAISGGVQTPTLKEILNETRPYDSPRGDRRPDNGWIGYVINPESSRTEFTVYVVCHS